ncbi:unnamed protein product [Agarophyton chilense]
MASTLDAMSSARSRRRRYAKLRSQRSNAPRALAAALFFFLLCYEMVVLRPPVVPKPSVSSRGAVPPPPPVAAASQAAPPQEPAQSASSPSAPPPRSPPPTSDSHIVAKAAVSPSSITARLAELQKLSSSTIPPSTSNSLRVAADAETSPPPAFHPLHKRHSRPAHHVSPSLAEMEKVAADHAEDADSDAASKRPAPARDSSHQPSKSEHRADPGAGENFWKWFQDTKETEGTTKVSCPSKSERVCLMFYKFLKKYKIRCVYDVSCARNLDWMPEVVSKVGKELWGFKYYCNTPDAGDLSRAKEKLAGLSYVQFAPDLWWRTGFAEDTQLLFAWDILPHIPYGRIWSFFVKSKTQNIKYLLFDNYPGIMNDPSPKRQYLNIRKHPFRFPAAKEVVQNVTEPGETEKRQLLFYETDMLPDNLQ